MVVKSLKVVSGSIGCGKTSVLHAIDSLTCDREGEVRVFTEDVSEWQFYLKKFYSEPSAYVFLFQKEVDIYVHKLTKWLEEMDEREEEVEVYIERSPVDVLYIFLQLNRGEMDVDEYQCLSYSMMKYMARGVWKKARYFMLEASPIICQERVAKRARAGEDKICIEYLERVSSLYQDLARKKKWTIIENGVGGCVPEIAEKIVKM